MKADASESYTSNMIRILAISGSLRQSSLNTALLRAAVHLAPPGIEILIYGGLGTLPLFNADLEGFEPPSVHDFRAELRAARGVLIASPEYAHGITGVLKNGLDWVVGSGEFVGKPVALLNTSTRATHAQESLKEVLKTMDAQIVIDASRVIPLPYKIDEAAILALPELSHRLRSAIASFANVFSEFSAQAKIETGA